VNNIVLDFSSAWPIGLILALILVVATTPLLVLADGPPIEAKSRVENLDGLRGFLALSVFFSHTLVYHYYLLDGRWQLTSFPLFTELGEAGVSVFFMITGYLFWSQLIVKGGRPDWMKLYIGRLFRILPLYWIAISLVLVGVACHTGPNLNVSPSRLVSEMAQWAAGGLRREIPINGYSDAPVLIAGVTWTLGYEWKFYAALLPLSLLARARGAWRWTPALIFAGIIGYLLHRPPPAPMPAVCASLFLCGMAVGSTKALTLKPWSNHLASALIVLLVSAIFVVFNDAFAPVPILLLGASFYLIVSGATGFGLLRTVAARRLGNISFGIYLLQGPVFAATFLAPGARVFALSSPLAHWLVFSFDGVVLVFVAAVTHALIEKPGIALGKTLVQRLGRSSRLPAVRSSSGQA
jgi:peptidoglycan/LPS O-acetylase OafA/YrhL